MLKKFAVVAVAVVVIGWAGTANATPILISSGGSYSTNFFWAGDGHHPADALAANLAFAIANLSSTQIVVDFKLTNTTVGVGAITAFGFSADRNASGLAGSTTGSGDLAGDTDVFDNFAMKPIKGLDSIELCMQAASIHSKCSGGKAQPGLAPGAFDGFRVILTGTGFASGITSFDDFGVKFKDAPGSFEFYSTGVTLTVLHPASTELNASGGPSPVPEPASIVLGGCGLALVFMRMRRKKA